MMKRLGKFDWGFYGPSILLCNFNMMKRLGKFDWGFYGPSILLCNFNMMKRLGKFDWGLISLPTARVPEDKT